jgi:hypothetical protein
MQVLSTMCSAAVEEEAVRDLHDVRLVDGVDLLAAILLGGVEGELRDARRSLLRDDLDGLCDARRNQHLDARVEVLGVFADDDHVNVRVVRLQAGQRLHRAVVREEVELLAQRDVDRREAAAYRRCNGAFQRDFVLLDGLVERLRDVLAGLGVGIGAGGVLVPVEACAVGLACGFEDADGGARDLGADAVAGDEGYFVSCHLQYSPDL